MLVSINCMLNLSSVVCNWLAEKFDLKIENGTLMITTAEAQCIDRIIIEYMINSHVEQRLKNTEQEVTARFDSMFSIIENIFKLQQNCAGGVQPCRIAPTVEMMMPQNLFAGVQNSVTSVNDNNTGGNTLRSAQVQQDCTKATSNQIFSRDTVKNVESETDKSIVAKKSPDKEKDNIVGSPLDVDEEMIRRLGQIRIT